MIEHVVYYSSATENTHRFVQKLGLENTRIPILKKDTMPIVDKPFVLIIPTYGGGAALMGRDSKPVLPQIYKFLDIEENRKNMKAVIASGNLNFGEDYCKAGDVISKKFNVPYVYRFELLGNERDVAVIKDGLKNFEI